MLTVELEVGTWNSYPTADCSNFNGQPWQMQQRYQ